jgi:prepilin-type N-terminal cleavage/methylation domain-containing protein/prepilin-type processing-associated H-X9-DG protein
MPQRGFTLVELLVVIAIIMTLAGFGLSGANLARESARATACQTNQRQMVLAMLTFREDYEGWWPDAPNLRPGPYDFIKRYPDGRPEAHGKSPIMPGDCNAWCPIVAMECLASWSDGELGRRIFTCPSSRIGPRDEANARLIEAFRRGVSPPPLPHWWDIADSAYCYDNGLVGDQSGRRAITADRPITPDLTAHGQRTNVAFADGRTGTLRRSGTGGFGGRFRDWKDTFEWITFEAINENAGDDNIYDPIGDGIYADTPGGEPAWTTSTTRAWVR